MTGTSVTVLMAIVLGVLQGATEFFPVSSSGHLVLAQRLMGLEGPELAFDILLHLGTVLAILLFLRKEIASVLTSLYRREKAFGTEPWGRRDLLLIIAACVPTAVIGYAFHDVVERGVSVRDVGIWYLVLTGILLASDLRLRHKADPERIDLWEAVAIGIMQGIAVFPGLSRSGSTISLALVLGIGASRGAKFSFLLSVPAIVGATALHLSRGLSGLPGPVPSALGFLFSLVVSYAAIALVERVVIRGKFPMFAPYTLLLALVSFWIHWAG